MKCYVFVYGTLLSANVRKQVLGYDPPALPSSLRGFRKHTIRLGGKYYPILTEDATGLTIVDGEYFEISESELDLLDAYETNAYQRRKVSMENGKHAWVYCSYTGS